MGFEMIVTYDIKKSITIIFLTTISNDISIFIVIVITIINFVVIILSKKTL